MTPSGEQRALSLVRAHRMYEKYLAEHSGYAPEEWHSKADEMEHNLGKQDKERIMALLRNPLWDPHGDPIPTERYQMPESHRTIATEVKAGTWYKVLHIEDDDKKSFRQISSIGLASGTTIQICALEGERLGAGSSHADNIAPSIYGGFVLVRRADHGRKQQQRRKIRQ